MLCLVCHHYYDPSHAHQCPARIAQEPPRMRPPVRSQKARGVLALAADPSWNVPRFMVLSEPPPNGYAWNHVEAALPAWGRPCPITPRHGFVDSRSEERRVGKERRAARQT